MTEIASIDFETRSVTDLRKAGVYRYAEDPTTVPWGFCWRIGSGFVQEWNWSSLDPTDLINHIAAGGLVVAHNAGFERAIWNMIMRKYKPHWPELKIGQQSCTMARACAVGLPADLDGLGVVLGLTNKKDRAGHALMMKMAKPRGYDQNGQPTWWDEPDNVFRLLAYCDQDVRTERDAGEALPYLTNYEQLVWQLDQTINDRGIAIDVDAARGAVLLVDYAKKKADAEMRRLTNGQVRKVSEVAKIVAWLQLRGIPCETMRKGDVEDLLFQTEIVNDVTAKEVIELRRNASKTSTAKFSKMLDCVGRDGRIRGLLAYWGARPGRWAGRLVQPQNFPRFDREDKPQEAEAATWLVGLLAASVNTTEIHEAMQALHGDTLGYLSKSLRSMFVAAPGRKLVGGDFANIEGRVNAWLAGEAWKLQAFAEYDLGTGPDLYKITAASILGKQISEVTKPERQGHGKVPELACGYQGGVGAFVKMGANYNVNAFDIAKVVEKVATSEQWDSTAIRYEKAQDKRGLQEREWTAVKIVVTNWRAKNQAITSSWWAYAEAAVEAVKYRNTIVNVAEGRIPIRFMADDSYLYCCLPSGRVLCYAQPRIQLTEVILVDKNGEEYTRTSEQVRFWGVDSETKQWVEQYLYGGRLCENIVQAIARDLMVHAMFTVEAAGYAIVLTVHDELLAEVLKGFGSATHFEQLMLQKPGWAGSLPISASTYEDERYTK